MEDRKKLITSIFNEFNGKNIDVLVKLYDDKVFFQDPVTEVKGLKSLEDYYKKAYAAVKYINFDFKKIDIAGNVYTCQWVMTLQAGILNFGKKYDVKGASIMTFSDESNKVIEHIDYVDLGSMVYERVPGVGSLVRAIKSKLH